MKTTGRTTGIGSLPHHNIDSALQYSFKMGIPFLPQIPIRNHWEFMIAQALEGLPGILLDPEGNVCLNTDVWQGQSHTLDHRLQKAFAGMAENSLNAFESFEPGASTSSCWQPFLWELQERGLTTAKIQIAGPLTCQWALRLQDQTSPDRYPELCSQIFQLILARSIAMVRRMKASGIQPILYLDEPGLYALSLQNPKHVLALQELKLSVQTLKKEQAIVGLHCCSDTDWGAVLQLGLDILSIDTSLSLASALSYSGQSSLLEFVEAGGKLSLGAIPTGRTSVLQSLDGKKLAHQIEGIFKRFWEARPELIQKALAEAFFTPACGLALQSTSDSELILERLMEVYAYFDTP